MKALILAAGFGTRLRPHSLSLPKSLFPIDGRPVLGHMIDNLKRAGCTEVAVNAHHLADRISTYVDENDFGLPVHLSHESEILGTGGAIRHLSGFWGSNPFLVVNADIVSDIDLSEVYRVHCKHGRVVTLVMHDREPFNHVWVDDRDRVTGFDKYAKPMPHDNQRKMAFTGVHVMDAAIVGRIPGEGFSDIISVYQQMIDKGLPIHAHVVDNHYWQDMGTPERYREAVVDAMAPKAFQSTFPDAEIDTIHCHQLSGDGSDRRWFRLVSGQCSLILADHGITTMVPGSEVNAFVRIGHHLSHCGLPVPRIIAYDGFSGLVFLEDLGDLHLQQVVRQSTDSQDTEALYQTVIDTLLDLTVSAWPGFDPGWTCQSRAYDASLIREMECRYFVEAFLNGYLERGVSYDELAPEFEHLAKCTVRNGITGLIHRDFQSRNLMVHNGKTYWIDFQGARTGPVQYDLASLLIDPYVALSPAIQEHLLNYAATQAAYRLQASPEDIVRGYRYCRVTRNLQMLGAFGFLSRVKQKKEFASWIPTAANMLAGHIRSADDRAFPKLTAIAESIRFR